MLHVVFLLSLQQLLRVPAVTSEQQQHISTTPSITNPTAATANIGVSYHFVAVVLMPTHSPSMDLMTAAAHLLAR
jgi:hypothetical protein